VCDIYIILNLIDGLFGFQELARGNGEGVNESVNLDIHAISELKSKGLPPTIDLPKYDYSYNDSGKYVVKSCEGTIAALRCNNEFVNEITSGQQSGIVLDQTCFYAEQGGQIYDEGFIVSKEDEGNEFIVKDVQVKGGYVLHIGSTEGSFKVGDKVTLTIDSDRRNDIMKNHTGTHVLNFALRKELGEADQKGSLVAPDRLRFDFTAKSAMKLGQIKSCEETVLDVIQKNYQIYARETPLLVAKEIKGLRAVFDEVYPDPVRVLSIGVPVEQVVSDPTGPWALDYSVEFCGGTYDLNMFECLINLNICVDIYKIPVILNHFLSLVRKRLLRGSVG
jgi:alanyl-tRNA synthetase